MRRSVRKFDNFLYLKKTAAEKYQLLVEVCVIEHVLIQEICKRWCKRFKSSNFDVEDKEESVQLKTFENADFQSLDED